MALTTTPEALLEIGRLHARIAQLELLCGIRAPAEDAPRSGPPASATDGLLELVADFADEMVVLCDLAGKILLANAAAERVLGYRPQQMVGTNAWAYVHPEDLKATAAARSAPLDDGIPFENRALAADGTYRWVEFTARRWPATDPTHVLLRFRRALHREPACAAAGDEAAARLQVPLRYASSLARLSQLALGLPLVSDVLDAATALGASGLGVEIGAWLVPVGDALEVVSESGLPPGARGSRAPLSGSLAGLAWRRRATVDAARLPASERPEDPLLAGAAAAVAVPVAGAARAHGILLFAGRSARGFEPDALHFAEAVANVLATALDARGAQEALGEREKLIRAVFEASWVPLVVLDDGGRCVEANRAAHDLFRLQPGDLPGRSLSEAAGVRLDLSELTGGRRIYGQAALREGASAAPVEYALLPQIVPGRTLLVLRAEGSPPEPRQ